MSNLSQFSSGIKSIQSGTVAISGAGTTGNATITSVDTTKAVVLYLGQTSTTNDVTYEAYIELTSATNIRATRNSSAGGPTTTVSFMVLEFY